MEQIQRTYEKKALATLEMRRRKEKQRLEDDFSAFVKDAWHIIEPGTPLIWNWHLNTICAYLEAYVNRRIKRLILNIPPGTMKSVLVSVMMPAWTWTKYPERRFINLTNEIGLATRDSRRMRDIVTSDWYQRYWGDGLSLTYDVFESLQTGVALSKDQSEKANFENTSKGFRQGLGITGNISGKRGTDLVIDDPIDTKKAFSDVEIQSVNDAYDQAVSSRLNDMNRDAIVLIMQRTRTNDLTGHLLSKKRQKWMHVCIPMEFEGAPAYDPEKDLGTYLYHGRDIRDPRKKRGELMFAERFNRNTVEALKEDLGDYGTAGQLQQRPSPLSGGILKKPWWKVWGEVPWTKGRGLPRVKHVFCSFDTAFSEKDLESNAYTAMTAWGVFWDEDKQRDALLLLDAWWKRADYPTLRSKSQSLVKDLDMLDGDAFLIESKASGISLIQDLRKMRFKVAVNIRGYDPRPDGDKVARAFMAQALLKSGSVWIPDKEWAHEVVDIVAEFPAGGPPCADLTDTTTQAIIYLKRRHYVTHPDDEDNEPDDMPEAANYDAWPEDKEEKEEVGVYG